VCRWCGVTYAAERNGTESVAAPPPCRIRFTSFSVLAAPRAPGFNFPGPGPGPGHPFFLSFFLACGLNKNMHHTTPHPTPPSQRMAHRRPPVDGNQANKATRALQAGRRGRGSGATEPPAARPFNPGSYRCLSCTVYWRERHKNYEYQDRI
jgi:hypothetical protein